MHATVRALPEMELKSLVRAALVTLPGSLPGCRGGRAEDAGSAAREKDVARLGQALAGLSTTDQGLIRNWVFVPSPSQGAPGQQRLEQLVRDLEAWVTADDEDGIDWWGCS